jgi:hypothetical protein
MIARNCLHPNQYVIVQSTTFVTDHKQNTAGEPWLSGARGRVFLVPLMSFGAQREKDFPLLDRPELPAEKMRAGSSNAPSKESVCYRASEARFTNG